jgi:hypothetical protein
MKNKLGKRNNERKYPVSKKYKAKMWIYKYALLLQQSACNMGKIIKY